MLRRSGTLACATALAFALLLTLCPTPRAAAQPRNMLESRGGLKYSFHPSSAARPGLIIMLHGTGGNGGVFLRGWVPGANKNGYSVALPMSSGVGTPRSGNRNGDNASRWDDVDEDKVVDLAKELISAHNLDPKRVALVGYSNGAFHALVFGIRHPELFSATVCNSGGCNDRAFKDDAKGVGVYIIHGDQDQAVNVVAGQKARDDLKAAGFTNVVYKEYPGRGHDVFFEECDAVFEWMKGCVRHLPVGGSKDVTFATWESIADRLGADDSKPFLAWFASVADDDGTEFAEWVEYMLLAHPSMQALIKQGELTVVFVDRTAAEDVAKAYRVRKPTLALIDASKQRVIEKVDKQIEVDDLIKKLKRRLKLN